MTFDQLPGIIRGARTADRKSLRTLATEVGLSYSYLSKIENGKLRLEEWPSGDTLLRLCEALCLPKAQVLACTGKVPTVVKEALKKPNIMAIMLNLALEDAACLGG